MEGGRFEFWYLSEAPINCRTQPQGFTNSQLGRYIIPKIHCDLKSCTDETASQGDGRNCSVRLVLLYPRISGRKVQERISNRLVGEESYESQFLLWDIRQAPRSR